MRSCSGDDPNALLKWTVATKNMGLVGASNRKVTTARVCHSRIPVLACAPLLSGPWMTQ